MAPPQVYPTYEIIPTIREAAPIDSSLRVGKRQKLQLALSVPLPLPVCSTMFACFPLFAFLSFRPFAKRSIQICVLQSIWLDDFLEGMGHRRGRAMRLVNQ